MLFLSDRVVSYIMDKLYEKTFTGQTGGKINYYLSLAQTPELLVMGNSRAFYQIIPDSFNISTYNIAHAGTDDGFNAALLNLLIQKNKYPKKILLQIDPEYYIAGKVGPIDTISNSINILQYYYGTNDFITDNINKVSPSQRFFFLFQSYRYNNHIINIFNNYYKSKSKENISHSGFEAILPSPVDSINVIYSAQTQSLAPYEFSPYKTNYLKTIISLCLKNNIKLILFTSPYFDAKTQNYLAPVLRKIDSLAKENSLQFINYIDNKLPLITNNTKYWKDNAHLNYLGARIESSDLAKRLRLLDPKLK
jgi:hypothetical protein